jgi:hypothetical protein
VVFADGGMMVLIVIQEFERSAKEEHFHPI